MGAVAVVIAGMSTSISGVGGVCGVESGNEFSREGFVRVVNTGVENGDVDTYACEPFVLGSAGGVGVARSGLNGARANVIHDLSDFLPLHHRDLRQSGELGQVVERNPIHEHEGDHFSDVLDLSEFTEKILNLARRQTCVEIDDDIHVLTRVEAFFDLIVDEVPVFVANPCCMLPLAD